MPLYLDVHNKIEALTADVAADAHRKDLEIQQKHGVNYLRYWFDEGTGKVFCLVEAPSKEAAEAVHREAHRTRGSHSAGALPLPRRHPPRWHVRQS